MKNLAKNPLFYTSLVLAVLLGFRTYSLVFAWNPPAGTPPNAGNVSQPLDTSPFRQIKSGNLVIGSDATPSVEINGVGLPRISFNESGTGVGKIYLSNGKFFAQASNQNGGISYEIGSGAITKIVAGTNVSISPDSGVGVVTINATGGTGAISKIIAGTNITISPTTGVGDVTINATGGAAAVSAPLKLQTGSGGTGIILEKNPNDQRGFNSPRIIFSVYGASVGYNVKDTLSRSLFSIPVAKALVDCPFAGDAGCGVGGGGGGPGGTYVYPGGVLPGLGQPIWWMRQEEGKLVVSASDGYFSQIRPLLVMTNGGGVFAGGSGIPGNAAFFEWKKSVNDYVQVAPAGTWCGLGTWFSCNGIMPDSKSNCPSGYEKWGLKGAFQTQGNNEVHTCVKL